MCLTVKLYLELKKVWDKFGVKFQKLEMQLASFKALNIRFEADHIVQITS